MKTRRNLIAVAAILGLFSAVIYASTRETGRTFADVAQDTAAYRRLSQSPVPAARKSSGSGAQGRMIQTEDAATSQTITSMPVEFLFQQDQYAMELTRYFATKHGLDPQGEMPLPLAEAYEAWIRGETPTEAYLTQLQQWLNNRPLWLN